MAVPRSTDERSTDEGSVLLVSHYYTPHVGGIEVVVRNEAERLAARGVRVRVLTGAGGARPGRERVGPVQITRVRAWNVLERAFGVPFPICGPSLLTAAWREVRRAGVVHLHDAQYLTSWAAALACRATGTPYVITQHVDLVEHPSGLVRLAQRLVHRLAGRRVLRGARTVFVLNDRVRAFVVAAGVAEPDVELLPNGVDTQTFHPADHRQRSITRAGRRWASDDVVVLFVGRPAPKKGFDVLRACTDRSYRIVAAGPPRPVTGSRAARAGAAAAGVGAAGVGESAAGGASGREPDVELLGELGVEQLPAVYRDADVFVLPSRSEGFPLTVQEAMASGLPVVTTDDWAYDCYRLDRSLIRLIDPTPHAVRTALRELAGSPELRRDMGEYSRSVAVGKFSWEAHLDTLDRTYRRAGQARAAR
jgi:D-inositol-3-phosphate glycosyltransferase